MLFVSDITQGFKYVNFHIYIIDNQTFNIILKNNHTKVLTNTKKTTNFAVSNQLKIRRLEVKNKRQKIKQKTSKF